MSKYLLIALMLIGTLSHGQKVTVKGQLLDTLGHPFPSATVLLMNPADSTLINFAISNGEGVFQMKNVSRGEHWLKVTSVGFKTFSKKFTTPEGTPVLDVGIITMEPSIHSLDEIEIEAERAPVTVRHDTIEFNAGSFKTKENAVVEDLLKKLPGVEVDQDGNVTAQGEQVRRVTVDGKNFFGTDPKLATKNLPADAVDKVQVFDKKSDQAAFSGVDDGQREKTINLELKPEKRNGAFGSIMGGGGTEGRFQARTSINKFTKGRQLSLLGMGNNVNEQGFSMEEYLNFTGGSQQMMGGGAVRFELGADNQSGVPLNFGNRANGIMTTYAGGFNVNNEFSKNTEVNGSYFYNHLDHDKDQTIVRENFLPTEPGLPTRSFSQMQGSRQANSNANHRLNLTLDQKLDSMNSLKLTSNFSLNETDSRISSKSETYSENGAIQNASDRLSISSGTGLTLNGNLLWRHRFSKKGRNFSTNFQFGLSENDRSGTLDAVNNFYGDNDSSSTVAQRNLQETYYQSVGGSFSYTEPLGKRKYLEGNYTYRQNLNDVNREVFDITDQEEVTNEILSNKYNSNYQFHRTGLNFRVTKARYNFVLGASVQQTHLKGDLESFDTLIDRRFQNLLPVLRLNYDFSTSRHFGFDYETTVQEPGIQQLQPVVDNSDPLNLYVGNPNLRPAYNQSARMNFRTFDPATFVSFFAFVDLDYTTNAIVNAQRVNEQLVRITQPVNVDDNVRLNSNASVSFPINQKGSRLNVGGNFQRERSIALLNDQENRIYQNTFGANVRYSYRYKEILDFSLSADLDKQLTQYDFVDEDQSFVNQIYSAETNITFLRNYQFSGTFEYLFYKSVSTAFEQSIPLLNLSVSRFMLKNKAGELKLSATNLLDKALGVNQIASVNYLERQTTNSLGRYFMLSFTYALNKQLNPMGMRRGGMMRIVR